jgi:hypothetical protein
LEFCRDYFILSRNSEKNSHGVPEEIPDMDMDRDRDIDMETEMDMDVDIAMPVPKK